MKKWFVSLLSFCILFMTYAPMSFATTMTTHDFRHSNYDTFYENLNGNWNFIRGELFDPQDMKEEIKLGNSEIVKVPYMLNQRLNIDSDRATYSTTIKVPESFVGRYLKFYIPFQYSSYNLYVNNVLIKENGSLLKSNKTAVQQMKPQIPSFRVDQTTLQITFQMISFENVSGGLRKSISIGNEQIIVKKQQQHEFWQVFLIGCITLTACISLLFYAFRRKQKEFLAYGMFCAATSLWSFFTDYYLYTAFLNQLDWSVALRLTFIMPQIVMLFYVGYVYKMFSEAVPKKFITFYNYIMIVIIFFTAFSSTVMYQRLFNIILIFMYVFYIFLLVSVIRKINWHDLTQVITLVGILLVFVGAIHDMIRVSAAGNSIHLTFIMLGIFISIQCILFCRKFALQWLQVEQLNKELISLNESLDEKIRIRTKQLEESNEKLRELALLDSLTGVFNRHYLSSSLEKLYKHYKDTKVPFAILILDVDEFKKYNDYYGHILGDQLLKNLVKILTDALPARAELTRYGGEEFVVLLDATTYSEAFDIAEYMRNAVEKAELEHLRRECKVITISVGGVALTEAQFTDTTEFVKIADQQLYEAKNAGRNCVRVKNLH